MSKIICDVCGTSFPETASQCPICGCVRHTEAVSLMPSSEAEEVKNSSISGSNYNYVKGGRFSKANVRKRSRGGNIPRKEKEAPNAAKKNGKKSDAGLVVAVVVLLLAIMLAVAYIVLRVFGYELFPTGGDRETTIANNNGGETTSEYIELDVPCTSLVITPSEVTLSKIGATWLLDVQIQPDNSTDKDITFASENAEIATVDASGNITAVAPGQTYITVTCGETTERCLVNCDFEVEEDTSEQKPEYTLEDVKFSGLYDKTKKRYDITLKNKDQTHVFYADIKIPAEVITWSTDNKDVATVEDGVITAVGGGSTTITAEYADTKVTCIVRCAFSAKSSSGNSNSNNQTDTEKTDTETTDTYAAPYTLYYNGSKPYDQTDVTIKQGDVGTLVLKDVNGKTVNATWKASSDSISISGNKITGVSKNRQLTVTATFNGGEFTCTFRVS